MPDLPPLDWRGLHAPHYTQVPDEVFDVLMAYLSGAEFKVLCYIIRHTFGWKKETDAISLMQITSGIVRRDGTRVDHGTGLSKAGAVAAVKRLETLGIVEAVRHTSPERGHEPTTYRPIMALTTEQTSYPEKLDEGRPLASQALVQSVDTQETASQQTINKNGSGRDERGLLESLARTHWRKVSPRELDTIAAAWLRSKQPAAAWWQAQEPARLIAGDLARWIAQLGEG
jgi:hypothetical protein